MLAIGTGRVEPECPSTPTPATTTLACPDDGQGRSGREPGRTYFFAISSVARFGFSGLLEVATALGVVTAAATGAADGGSTGVRASPPGSSTSTSAAPSPV